MEQQTDPWGQDFNQSPDDVTVVTQQQQGGRDGHLTAVAALMIGFGALTVLAGFVVLLAAMFGGAVGESQSGQDGIFAVAAGAGVLVFFILLIAGLPSIFAGVGILKQQEWGRILGFIVAALSLLNFPLGTAFGIYAIVILSRHDFSQQQQQEVVYS